MGGALATLALEGREDEEEFPTSVPAGVKRRALPIVLNGEAGGGKGAMVGTNLGEVVGLLGVPTEDGDPDDLLGEVLDDLDGVGMSMIGLSGKSSLLVEDVVEVTD